VDPSAAPVVLSAVLRALAVPLPSDLSGARAAEQLAWAARHWAPARLVARPTIADTEIDASS
jgi:glutamyl-Q tRNA(Asp) synthetase